MAAPRAARRLPRPGAGRLRVRLLLLLVVLTAAGSTTFGTGASFTDTTTAQAVVTAAADYYPPTVSVTSPGATVSGTVTVPVTAADTASGVVRVVVEVATSPSGAWSVLCTDTAAPWSCPWDTTKVADGEHRLRATATDAAGFSATSAVVTTRVANTAAVDLATVADVVRGAVPLSATLTGVAGRTVTTEFSYRLSGSTGAWTTIGGCGAVTGTTPTCSWSTTGLNDVYDVQVVSTLTSGSVVTTVRDDQLGVTVDNTAPTATYAPPSPLRGTVTLAAVVADEHSAVASVVYRYQPVVGGVPTGSVVTACTSTNDPFRCVLDTTTLANGTYAFSVVVTDLAGNTTTVSVNRAVDNSTASVAVTSPSAGDALRGTVAVTAAASPGAGGTVTSVVLRQRLVGTTAWTTICTSPASPYSCSWATPAGSGSYELSALLTYRDGTGASRTLESAVVPVTVDNSPLRALDVQASNGGTAGRVGAGDTVTLTYSALVDLGSIKTGWTGASTAVTATVRDAAVTGSTVGAYDRLIFDANLGQVGFTQNYVRNNRSVVLTGSTMTATTATVGGVQVTVVTVTLGSSASADLRTVAGTGTARWSPSTAARSTTGVAASATTAVESGAADADL